MCKFLPRNTIKVNGLILNILIGIIVICPIFFAGFDYKFVNINWSHIGKWRHLAKLQVSSVCGTFFSFILGILFFAIAPNSKAIGALFSFFEFITGVFSMFVSIFVLVGAYARTNELTEKCIIPNKNFFEQFYYLDRYFFKNSDIIFCGDDCKCNLNDKKAIDEFLYKYEEDDSSEFEESQIFYESLNIDNNNEILSILKCPNREMTTQFDFEDKNNNNSNQKVSKFHIEKFGHINDKKLDNLIKFWGRIEKKFHCTGWCAKSYKNINNTIKYRKYLFSDINNGLVKKKGCMKPYRNWVQKMLRAFGGMMLIDSFLQLICLIFGVSLFLGFTSENSSNERPIEQEEYGATQKLDEKSNKEHSKSN